MFIKDGFGNSSVKTPNTLRGFTLTAGQTTDDGNDSLTSQGPVSVWVLVTTNADLHILEAGETDTSGHTAYPITANEPQIIGLKKNQCFKISQNATCIPFDNCPPDSGA